MEAVVRVVEMEVVVAAEVGTASVCSNDNRCIPTLLCRMHLESLGSPDGSTHLRLRRNSDSVLF